MTEQDWGILRVATVITHQGITILNSIDYKTTDVNNLIVDRYVFKYFEFRPNIESRVTERYNSSIYERHEG